MDNTEGYSQEELDILNRIYNEKLDMWLLENKDRVVEYMQEFGETEEIRAISDEILDNSEEYLCPSQYEGNITAFGSGAHVVIPGKYLGKRIRYVVID